CTVSQNMQYKGYSNFKVDHVVDDPEIRAEIQLHNPNPIGATIRNMEMHLNVDGKELGHAGIDQKVRVKRRSDFTLPVTMGTTLPQLGAILGGGLTAFITDNEIPLELSGTFTVQKFIFFRKTFAFTYADVLRVDALNNK
ncbi:MAG: LEA type 2 family protein, partial [Chitinophagales bacterium]